MKRIAVLAVLFATLGTSFTALAADPCGCEGPACKPAAQLTAPGHDGPDLYEREFNQSDLTHRF